MPKDAAFEDLDILEVIKVIPARSFPAAYPTHWHTQIEILFISLEAEEHVSLSVMVNQTVYTLHRGDILFIWPGELHEILPNESNFFYGIQISPSLINNQTEFAEKYNLFCQQHLFSYEQNRSVSTQILSCFLDVAHHDESSDPYRRVKMLIGVYQFLIFFSQYIDILPFSSARSSKLLNQDTLQKIHSACSYIYSNCTKSLTLDRISRYTGFSTYYFSRTFKQVTGYSVTEYISIQRIRHAQQLLSDTTLSITEIAFQSGFKSIPTFNRVFKQFEGYSPSEFKDLYAIR